MPSFFSLIPPSATTAQQAGIVTVSSLILATMYIFEASNDDEETIHDEEPSMIFFGYILEGIVRLGEAYQELRRDEDRSETQRYTLY